MLIIYKLIDMEQRKWSLLISKEMNMVIFRIILWIENRKSSMMVLLASPEFKLLRAGFSVGPKKLSINLEEHITCRT